MSDDGAGMLVVPAVASTVLVFATGLTVLADRLQDATSAHVGIRGR